jgi:DNA-binding transcriptional ArsR family regulator
VDAGKLARIFKALSSDTRVRIVQLLRGRVLCVGALSAQLDVTQGAVSQHLRILRDAGLVVPERRGCHIHYRLDEKTVAKWGGAIGDLLSESERGGDTLCVTTKRRKRSARSRKT